MNDEQENMWRTLKGDEQVVSSVWCTFNFHKWTKWALVEKSKYSSGFDYYEDSLLKKTCIHCNTFVTKIIKTKLPQ